MVEVVTGLGRLVPAAFQVTFYFFFFGAAGTIQPWEIFCDRRIGGSARLVIQNEFKQLVPS